VLFQISEQGQVRELSRIATGLKDIYGVCLYQPAAGGLEVLVNDKDGTFQRHRLSDAGAAADGSPRIGSQVVQRFKLASQPEACVADDEAARLFIGEEDRGVWAMSLQDTAAAPQLQLIAPLGGLLHADVEGLGLARGAAGSYLVVSSQGNNSYVVLDAAPPYRVRGAFRVGLDAQLGIDGVSETDGLEVTTTALGANFPGGLLVLQDGFKRLPDGAQNFKLVRWDDVLRALALP
nr:phytase [Rubrivivax sp.]